MQILFETGLSLLTVINFPCKDKWSERLCIADQIDDSEWYGIWYGAVHCIIFVTDFYITLIHWHYFSFFFNILFLFCVQISINNKTNKEILNQTKKDVISLLDKKTREFMAGQIKISRFSHTEHTEQSLLDKMPQLLYRKYKAWRQHNTRSDAITLHSTI